MTNEQKRILFVLAETYQQFKAWCLDNDKSSNDPYVKFIYTSNDIRGEQEFDFTIYGTPHLRRDFNEIMSFLILDESVRRRANYVKTSNWDF
jgi:hypothetical protein